MISAIALLISDLTIIPFTTECAAQLVPPSLTTSTTCSTHCWTAKSVTAYGTQLLYSDAADFAFLRLVEGLTAQNKALQAFRADGSGSIEMIMEEARETVNLAKVQRVVSALRAYKLRACRSHSTLQGHSWRQRFLV